MLVEHQAISRLFILPLGSYKLLIVFQEFAIRRRMGIKDAQQHFLDDVARNGDLRPEQVDWLMKEHAKNQAKLETLYDEEISRQRMVLEEKLARRKQLAVESVSSVLEIE
jgi:hypothetical protein